MDSSKFWGAFWVTLGVLCGLACFAILPSVASWGAERAKVAWKSRKKSEEAGEETAPSKRAKAA